jgi:tetratricopeptide (TPR) repeat protein
MSRRRIGDRGLSTLFLVTLLIVSAAGLMGLKLKLEGFSRAQVPESSIIYIPSGQSMRLTSFGYQSVLADMLYLWAIQYYSDTGIADRYRNLDRIFTAIAELDPHYEDPYLTGALIAAYEARDLDLAFKILGRGMEKNPGEWLFPFEAGHYALLFKKDYDLARKYFERAMNLPGAPVITRRLYADAAFRTQDLDAAWKTWLNVYQTAPDERIKKIASNHLYQVQAAVDTARITAAVRDFKGKFHRLPMNLGQLVKSGFLPDLPLDLDGQDYLYDPRSGEVKSATIPWKR